MTTIERASLSALVALILSLSVNARSSAGITSMVVDTPETLPALLKEAVSLHPSIKTRNSEREAARYDLESAKWGRFPTLSANVETVKGGMQTVLSVQQPVWTGGRITSQIQLATAECVNDFETVIVKN